MGSFNTNSRGLRSIARAASVGLLSASMILAPLPGNISVANATALGAQKATDMLNGLAGPLSTGLGALTSAQGANSMLKGKQQLACCKEGCDGAGKEAAANKGAQDAAAQSGAKALPTNDGSSVPLPQARPPSAPSSGPSRIDGDGIGTGWNFHSLPETKVFLCSRAAPKAQILWDLFRPQRSEAMAGCNDAMMSMAQGAMQMLSGLAGMMAGMQGNKNSSAAGSNASALGDSTTAQSIAGTSLGNNGTGNTTPIKIDPSLLRDGKANSVYSEFEKNFGIPREDFANALANGADPRSLLMNAPKNAFTADELNQAFAAAKNMSQDQKNAALAAAGLGDLQNDLANRVGAVDPISTAGKGSRSPASSKELDDMGDLLGADQTGTSALSGDSLSPELQAALAERESAQVRDASNIFQVVHRKYQEKMRMIYGFDSRGRSIGGKGVANADGF